MFLTRDNLQHGPLMDKLQLWARSEETTADTLITKSFANADFEFIFKRMIPRNVTQWSVDVVTHKSYNGVAWSPDLISNVTDETPIVDGADTSTVLAKCFIYIYTPFPREFGMAPEIVTQINNGNSAPLVGTAEIQCFVAYASTHDINPPEDLGGDTDTKIPVPTSSNILSQEKRGLELRSAAPGYASSVQIEPVEQTSKMAERLAQVIRGVALFM